MASNQNDNHDVYSAQPAFPVLASSLLSLHSKNTTSSNAVEDDRSWDLKPALDNFANLSGYRDDPGCLFRCGSTIGFSSLRELNSTSEERDVDGSASRELLGEVMRKMLARYLLGLQNQNPQTQKEAETAQSKKSPRVFIIRPGHSPCFSPDALLATILQQQQQQQQQTGDEGRGREQAIDLLDHVELLTVHDFASATRAISQVSDQLYTLHHSEETETQTVVLIVEGLDTLAENVIRNSDAFRGSAVLTPALRTLVYLSRSCASFLAVLLVNSAGLGHHNNHHESGTKNTGLYSVFSRNTANDEDEAAAVPLLHTLLARTMDQAIDVHLLVQHRKKQGLIEVVKDRTGDGLGRWCIH